jgi:hypothetical protein
MKKKPLIVEVSGFYLFVVIPLLFLNGNSKLRRSRPTGKRCLFVTKLITKSITETLITMIAVKKGDRFASKSGNIVNISNIVFTTDKVARLLLLQRQNIQKKFEDHDPSSCYSCRKRFLPSISRRLVWNNNQYP